MQARAGPRFCGVLDALGPPWLTATVRRLSTTMLIECHKCKARVDAEEIGVVERNLLPDLGFELLFRTYLLRCPSCGCALIGEEEEGLKEKGQTVWPDLTRVHPMPRRLLGYEIPKTVRDSLEEAERCMQVGAFLAAAAMAGRALEAVCRHYSTKDTYIGAGIKELRDQGIIDARLFEWSEELREQRNMAAHATEAAISSEDAEDILTFTYAIVDYVFLLTRRFDRFQKRKQKKAEEKAKANARKPAA